jgi:hypothetical protein
MVRPITINRAFAELAFAIDHGTAPRLVAARARRYLTRTGEGHAFTERRAAWRGV